MKKLSLLIILIFINCKNNDTINKGFSISNPFEGNRILQKELIKEGNLNYYQSKLFSGIAFTMHNEKNIKTESTYENGKLNGSSKMYFKNGQIMQEENYENGLRDGIAKKWYENGQIKLEYNYTKGNLIGIQKKWYENGHLKEQTFFTLGKNRTGAVSVNQNGQYTSDYGPWYDENIPTGESKKWYENGTLGELSNYNKSGQLDGLQIEYYPNGKIFSKAIYENGVQIGKLQKWFTSGKMAYEKNFQNGIESSWKEDGTLQNQTIDYIEKTSTRIHTKSSNYYIFKEVKGNLNNDNLTDKVVVLKDTINPKSPYRLEIFLTQPNSENKLVLSSDKAINPDFPDAENKEYRGSPGQMFNKISIKKGILTISVNLARGHYEHKFRFQNNGFELIGFSKVAGDTESIEIIDFNLSTGIRIIKILNSSDKIVKNTKETIKIYPLPKLENFIPLENIYSNY